MMQFEYKIVRNWFEMHKKISSGQVICTASYMRKCEIVFLSSLLAEPASTKENNCLNAAKACNLNDTCKKYRSSYINPCTSRVSASEVCNKRKCHKALRQFFDKVIKHVNFESYLQLFWMFDFVIAASKRGVICIRKNAILSAISQLVLNPIPQQKSLTYQLLYSTKSYLKKV